MNGSGAYVELHARSAFSFLRGSSAPEELVQRAAELGHPAIALCDRDGVYGVPRAYRAAREHGIRCLVGSSLSLEDGSALPVLVRSREGYQNLCRLLTEAHLRAPKGEGRVRWEELHTFREGLVFLTGDEEGPVRRALERGDCGAAQTALRGLVDLVGRERVFVEMQRIRMRGEEWLLRRQVELAASAGVPLLATNGVRYARSAGRELCDAFTCLRCGTDLDRAGRRLEPNAEKHLKSAREMRLLFEGLPREALDNALGLAGELEFTLENLGYVFPEYAVRQGESMAGVLRRETYRGARRRYGRIRERVRLQLEHELRLIEKLGFCGYFLIVWDIVNFARAEGILVQGRGSAANSAVCYSLGITAVDPVASKLLFERFLSEGRNTWPDIDLDLPSGDRRERVIQEVYRRYAPRGAAMTANVITYRGRSAMREMGKALNLPEDVLERFSGQYASGDFPHTLELRDQLRQSGLSPAHPRFSALLRLFQAVKGLPRHLGQHSGGMVISDRGLDRLVPLEPARMAGRVVLQWDKEDCEDLGMVKVDLLGLGMMSAIQDALAICSSRGPDRAVDLAAIPKDDPAAFALMQRADTIGVFQIESRAQMATLPRMKPRCFYDVVIEAAIIRPGPIVGKLVHPYLNRRCGLEPVSYIDERFQPVLERTLGVPLFQEQVLKMAMIIADFTGSEAEELRRALSFHRSPERMAKVMEKLRAAMQGKGVRPEVQEKVVGSIQSFALYGFPESHAISFALLAYASAWLKVHRRAEFYTSLLNNQPMGFYSPATLLNDARRHGIRLRPVCVCASRVECAVDSDTVIRLGLGQTRGLSRESAGRIVAEREERPWSGMEDFLARTRLPKDERRVLARIGALNGLAAHRREALWKAEVSPEPGDLFANARARLAGDAVKEAAANLEPAGSPLAPMTAFERLEADYDGLRFTTGPHPMVYLRPKLPGVCRACDLAARRHGEAVTIAGLVICRQRPGTAKGHMFISLEDETGIANAFVRSDVFEKNRLVITRESFLRIGGTVQNPDGVVSVYTRRVEPLPFETALGEQSHDFY